MSLFTTLLIIFVSQLILYIISKRLLFEHIYLIKEFGVSIEKHYLSGSIQKTFIPRYKLRDVIINEALTPYNVKVYLALLVQGASELTVLFESFNMDTKRLIMGYEAIKGHIFK